MSVEDEAWEALSEAIQQFHRALGEEGIVTDWAVVAVRMNYEDDGRELYATSVTASQHQPDWKTLGLLEYGSETIRMQIRDDYEGD